MVVHVNLVLMGFFIASAHTNMKDNAVNFVGVPYVKMKSKYIVLIDFLFILGKVCEPNPCRNGGTCSPYGLDTYSCNCPFGYTGRNCETRKCNNRFIFQNSIYSYVGDPCIPNPCQNGGRCRSDVASGTYVCDCPTNFIGQNCETSNSVLLSVVCCRTQCIL